MRTIFIHELRSIRKRTASERSERVSFLIRIKVVQIIFHAVNECVYFIGTDIFFVSVFDRQIYFSEMEWGDESNKKWSNSPLVA